MMVTQNPQLTKADFAKLFIFENERSYTFEFYLTITERLRLIWYVLTGKEFMMRKDDVVNAHD